MPAKPRKQWTVFWKDGKAEHITKCKSKRQAKAFARAKLEDDCAVEVCGTYSLEYYLSQQVQQNHVATRVRSAVTLRDKLLSWAMAHEYRADAELDAKDAFPKLDHDTCIRELQRGALVAIDFLNEEGRLMDPLDNRWLINQINIENHK